MHNPTYIYIVTPTQTALERRLGSKGPVGPAGLAPVFSWYGNGNMRNGAVIPFLRDAQSRFRDEPGGASRCCFRGSENPQPAPPGEAEKAPPEPKARLTKGQRIVG